MLSFRYFRFLVLALGLGLLAACEDPEEAAERYYQSALELVEQGDVDRALVELRNVFEYDGMHQEARRLYADLVLEQGNVREAYSQYLRLIEQYPNTVEVRHVLADLALDSGNWDELERHGSAAIELAPDDPATRALAIAIDYREAMLARDEPEAAAAADEARALLETDPDLIVARRVLIDWTVQGPDPSRALPMIDRALEQRPTSRSLHLTRLSVLGQLGDDDATQAQLQRMYELFPDDEQISNYLISWYVSKGDFDAAEEFLRDQAGPDDAAPEGHMTVVQLIGEQRGPEAAIEELDRLAAANEGSDLGRLYASEAAALRFQTGDRDAAVAQIEDIIATAESSERRIDAKMILVRMRAAMDEQNAVLALVDEVLEEDPSQSDALKIRAQQKIRQNAFADAVTDLRAALDQSPTDADALILLADAQQKAGNLELAQQQLAQAVDVSNAAPGPSLIYARFLETQDRLPSAETVLTNSLAAYPENLDLARALGRVLLQRNRLAEAGQLVQQLQSMEAPQARQIAQALQASILFRQNRVDESLEYLQSQIGEGGNAGEELSATLQILRLQVQSNRLDDARATVQQLAERFPESQAVRVLQADLLSVEGETEEAIAAYREILDDAPGALPVVERLYRLLMLQDEADAAQTLVRDSLEVIPGARSLRLLEAGRMEEEGDIDGAIAIYEALYEESPNDLVAANNLASLLSVHGEDDGALERAYQISLRLTGARQPAFQDTLGWIQLQRGEVDQAIQNLQAAVRGLPDQPTVALNLGLAYAEAGRVAEAREEIERGLELAGGQPVPQSERARAVLAELGTDAQ